MVELQDVVASNQRIAATFPEGLVAVFVGGTSGVGEYTLKAFARYVPKPRAYLVGRSRESADRIIAECREVSPDGEFEFIQADISLLKSVDEVCRHIRARETAINLLVLSQGSTDFEAHTSEGLPLTSALTTHSRLRFVLNLLPLLQGARSLRRVVSVLAGTYEGPVDLGNLAGLGFPMRRRRDQNASIQTLLLEAAGRRAPDVALVHDVPGVVKSGILRDARGFKIHLLIWITGLLAPLINTPPDECGERHLFFATSAMYAPGLEGGPAAAAAGVPLGPGLAVAAGSDGRPGGGVYTIDNKGQSAPPRVGQVLAGLREDGTATKLWDIVTEDFKRITGSEVMA